MENAMLRVLFWIVLARSVWGLSASAEDREDVVPAR
jgi:hypothetical protein